LNISFPSKRQAVWSFCGLAVACLAALAGDSFAQTRPAAGLQNWALGQPNARVTLLEYGSLTCGHCAEFNNDIMPTIKRLYIDTGRVRYVFRPLPTPPFDLAVAMHALTLCAGPSRYYPLVEAYFERQQEVFNAARGETGPKGTLFAIAEDHGGLSYAAAEACLRDPARQTQVRANAEAGAAVGVTSTPTIFVNDVLVTVPAGQHHLEIADVTRALDAALRPISRVAKAKKR
jgi:protein-disulfide isomerase